MLQGQKCSKGKLHISSQNFEYSKRKVGDVLVPHRTMSSKITPHKKQEVVQKILESFDVKIQSTILLALPDPISNIVMLEKEMASKLSEDTFSG